MLVILRVWVVDVDVEMVWWEVVGVIHSLFWLAPTIHKGIGVHA